MTNEELADLLELTDWREPMLAVPRHAFVPDVGYACPENAPGYPIDRQARPDEWMRAVYSDASIITQRDDGAADPTDPTATATSSISAPGIAFKFLDLLSVRDHDRVLDVGTGTGYTTAVLSKRLGDTNVTSIEVDPEVGKQAAANLEAVGCTPGLIIGDAATMPSDEVPFDRVHVTCAVSDIPYSWIELTRPGGVIVVPWQPNTVYGHMVRLTVVDHAAYGTFHGGSGYMMLREQRRELRWNPHDGERAEVTATRLDPRSIAYAPPGARLALSARSPRTDWMTKRDDSGAFSLLLYEIGNPAGSWAACYRQPGAVEYEVRQYGDRRLWDEVEGAFAWWVRQCSPGPERFGLVVSAEGQHIWLSEPSRLV